MPERCDILAGKNPHPRDEHIVYVDETHSYFLDGKKLPLSVTGLWSAYFPHFDADATLDKYFANWVADPKSKYHTLIKYLDVVHKMPVEGQRNEIKRLWECSGTEASGLGTEMHRDIEFFYNGLQPEAPDAPEFLQFRRWWETFMPDAKPEAYRTEFSIYDADALIAGQIDCLLRTQDGRYVMVDWKRCNPTPKRPNMPLELLGTDQKAFNNERGLGPCAGFPNTSFWHYVVQQRLYTYILETHYDIKVDSAWLVQMHPTLSEAHCVEVPRIDDEIDRIMQARYEEVRSKRARVE